MLTDRARSVTLEKPLFVYGMYNVTLAKVHEPCLNPVFSEAYLVVTLIYYA